MENKKQLIQQAMAAYQSAERITEKTFPTLQEPKLLMQATEKIYESLVLGMQATLTECPNTIEEQLKIFEKNNPITITLLIKDLKNRIDQQKKSMIEFTRKGKFIAASDHFSRIQIIDLVQVKGWLMQTRPFLEQIRSTHV